MFFLLVGLCGERSADYSTRSPLLPRDLDRPDEQPVLRKSCAPGFARPALERRAVVKAYLQLVHGRGRCGRHDETMDVLDDLAAAPASKGTTPLGRHTVVLAIEPTIRPQQVHKSAYVTGLGASAPHHLPVEHHGQRLAWMDGRRQGSVAQELSAAAEGGWGDDCRCGQGDKAVGGLDAQPAHRKGGAVAGQPQAQAIVTGSEVGWHGDQRSEEHT